MDAVILLFETLLPNRKMAGFGYPVYMNFERMALLPSLLALSLILTAAPLPSDAATKPTYANRMKLAESMYFNGNLEGAIRAFQTACELNPKAFEPHLGLVNLHVNNADIPAAIAECHVCLQMKPDHRDVHLILGNLLRAEAGNETDEEKQKKMMVDAEETIGKAIKLGANEAMCENTLGLIALQLKQHDKALKHIDAAIKAQPSMADAHLVRGVLLFRQITAPAQAAGTKIDLTKAEFKAPLEEVMKELETAIKLKPKNADAKNTRGDILMGMGKSDEAFKSYNEALEDDPNYFQAWVALGNHHANKNEFDKARKAFQTAHEITPTDRNAMYGLALMHEKAGEITEAIMQFEEALMGETDPVMKASIKMHVSQLRGTGGSLFSNIPSIALPTEKVGDNLFANDSSSLKSETSSLLNMKRPGQGDSKE